MQNFEAQVPIFAKFLSLFIESLMESMDERVEMPMAIWTFEHINNIIIKSYKNKKQYIWYYMIYV